MCSDCVHFGSLLTDRKSLQSVINQDPNKSPRNMISSDPTLSPRKVSNPQITCNNNINKDKSAEKKEEEKKDKKEKKEKK